MGSRLRPDPDHIYEVFLELGESVRCAEEPCIIQIFPETYNDEEVLNSVPKFAFPCLSNESVQEGEHFAFVLTDIESRFKFGFCRVLLRTQTCISCLCVISCLPWYDVFYQTLDYISDLLSNSCLIAPFLGALHVTKSFRPGENVVVTVPNSNRNFRFRCPVPNQLPSLPDNKNLLELSTCFDVSNLMIIFTSLLYERRILAYSRSLSRLTRCIAGASLLLYPMNWQHLYIPVLPPHLLDYCSAPMPYLIGLHSSVMKKVKVQELGDTVIINVDENSVKSEYDDLSTLPGDVVSSLKRRLKQQDRQHGSQSTRDGTARAFIKAMVALIGGYRDALKFRPGELITFDPDAFVVTRPTDMQPLLRKILQLQTFQQFVSDRLDLLNAGEGFKDEFDIEASLYSDKWGTQSRYKDWLGHMKKQGKKMRREGKDRWLEFTSKVRDRSRKTWKDLASRVEETKKNETETATVYPNAMSSSIYNQPHRPPRPPPPNLSQALGPVPVERQSTARRQSLENRVYRHHSIQDETDDDIRLKMEGLAFEDMDLNLNSLQRISTDLMADPDIQRAFRKSYSFEVFGRTPGQEDSDNEEPDDAAVAVTWDQLSVPDTLDSEKWTPVDSEVSLNSKSSGSTTASDFIPSSGRDFSVATERAVFMLHADSSRSFNSLENVEFDPLKQPIIEEQLGLGTEGPGVTSPPVPRPHHAKFANRPSASPDSTSSRTVAGRSAPTSAHCMRRARAAFLQSDVVKPILPPRQESLNQFDPLASGQLVVDLPCDFTSGRSAAEDEDNLLKEWNLDFDRIGQASGRGFGPDVLASGAAFSSMPNLFRSAYPSPGSGHLGIYREVHNPLANCSVPVGPSFQQHLVGAAQVVPENFSPPRHPHTAVLHPAPNALRPYTPSTAASYGFSARSATLPVNAGLSPDVCNRNTGRVLRVPLSSSLVPSDHMTLHQHEGLHSRNFDPLLPSKRLQLDPLPQDSNRRENF